MNVIKDVKLDDGTVIFVEMQDSDVPLLQPTAIDLPAGAELAGAAEKLVNAATSLQQTFRGIFQLVHEAVRDKAPTEWGVQLNIGFKGKSSPIPVILSGEANASIKVHANWVKPKQE